MKTTQGIPRAAATFLRWFCDPELLEDVEGDIAELYERKRRLHPRMYRILIFLEVIKLFRPGIIRSFEGQYQLTNYGMIKNYLVSSMRHLMKHQRFSMINIFSLTLGMAACIVIYLFVQDERSFDGFHDDKDQLYRLCEVQSFPGTNTQKVALSMPGMGPTMLNEFPEIENFTRYRFFGKQAVTVDGQNFLIDQVAGVDSTFLHLFDYKIIAGNRDGQIGLSEIYISESVAKRLYNSLDVVGLQLRMDEDLLRIKGVIADIPDNSHLQFDMLFNIHLSHKSNATNAEFDNTFGSNYLNTYFKINANADLTDMRERYPEYLSGHMDDEINDIYKLFLQPLEEVHLGSMDIEHDYNNHRKFNGTYINIFILTGIFILIIATVNFMNLTTARASNRAKEVGVRKTIGAVKGQLFGQFILESSILALVSFLLAIILAAIALPFLNVLIDRQFSLMLFFTNHAWVYASIATLALGFMAGMYPAIYLSSFQPVDVLKGLRIVARKSVFRSSLVVVQFSLAVGMIVCTIVVLQQLDFMKNKDIGYETEHILLVDLRSQAQENYDKIKQDLKAKSNILGVTASGQRIGSNFHQWGAFEAQVDTGMVSSTPSNINIDYDYLEVYGIQLVDGRSLSKKMGSDPKNAFIVNQALVKELGIESPVGTKAAYSWYDTLGSIVGVTEDFHFNSLHFSVNTLVMSMHPEWGFSEMSVKLNGQNLAASIADVEEVYNTYVTDYPFEYEFLDSHFNELYKSDAQLGSIITIVAVLAILIGCMGLFGLASIAIERRIKEIGIRKVLGANLPELVVLLSRNFGVLVLLAFAIAAPITWLYLADWLNGFAYRIDMQIWVFIAGGMVSFLIAMGTISFHVIKAALSNPMESLRYE